MKLRKRYLFALIIPAVPIVLYVINFYLLSIPECRNPYSMQERNRCAYLSDEKMEQGFSKLSYPKVEDKIWTVNGVDILPSCLEVVWISSDNYEEYEEHFPAAKEIYRYPGKYWGDTVPLEPLNASWGEPVSLPKKISECNVLASNKRKETEGNYSALVYSESDDDREMFCPRTVPYHLSQQLRRRASQ